MYRPRPGRQDRALGAGKRQRDFEGVAPASEIADRAHQRVRRRVFEAAENVGERGPGPGGKVQQHRQASGTGLAAAFTVPREDAVRHGGDDSAFGLGVGFKAVYTFVGLVQSASQPQQKRQHGNRRTQDADQESRERSHCGTDVSAIAQAPSAPSARRRILFSPGRPRQATMASWGGAATLRPDRGRSESRRRDPAGA